MSSAVASSPPKSSASQFVWKWSPRMPSKVAGATSSASTRSSSGTPSFECRRQGSYLASPTTLSCGLTRRPQLVE